MAQVLYGLALFACPLGMGAIMWLMMSSGKEQPGGSAPSRATEAEVAQLRAELDEVRANQSPATTDITEAGTRRTMRYPI